jgi:5-methylthioadenosine/S-adenosylhomocysteine deaminase
MPVEDAQNGDRDGEVIYAAGRFTKVDRDAALKSLHDELN